MEFNNLALIKPILNAISDKGYTTPTAIQEKAIPQILNRKDVLGIAQTGTGKTAAFAIPIIQLIHRIDGNKKGKKQLRALILTPTRELAIQIDENIKAYNKYTKISHVVVYGGVKQGRQVDALKKGVQVLVATPGRLLDLFNQGYLNMDNIKIFVLDEADRMLDMGFIHDIKKLIKILPKKRQTLFFSATMPDNIVSLSKNILNNPKRIEVARQATPAETIQQFVYYTDKENKVALLNHILEDKKKEQFLIFTRTKYGADKLVRKLKRLKYKADAIHGNKSQQQRQKTLRKFKDGITNILVATDIAARGIDINALKYVVNYEIPNVPETYVHRIGRSGRAGEEGTAFSISEPEENAYVLAIEKLIKKSIEKINHHPYPQTQKPMSEKQKKEWNKEKQRKKQQFINTKRKQRNKWKKGKNRKK